MHFTEWKLDECKSYYQCLASLYDGCEPIFIVRAVLSGNGDFQSIVREYMSGHMLSSGAHYNTAVDAAKDARYRCEVLLRSALSTTYDKPGDEENLSNSIKQDIEEDD